jgi:hypothetical protein
MDGSPLRRYEARDVVQLGGAAAAERALERIHGGTHEFVLHIDLGVIAPEDFRAAISVSEGGPAGTLPLSELREALAVFVRQPTLAALEISGYNPALDADGEGAKKLIDLLVQTLSPRLAKPVEENGAAVQADSTIPAASSEDARPADTAAPGAPAEPSVESSSAEGSTTGSAPAENPSAENASVETVPVESPSVENVPVESSAALENPQPAVERESPGESPGESGQPSETPDSVDRETPDS